MTKIELPTVETVKARIAELDEERKQLHALLRLLEGKTFRVPVAAPASGVEEK